MRAVIDTNVAVTAFLTPTGPPANVIAAWRHQRFQAVVSPQILDEYGRALRYERVASRHGITPEEVDSVLADLLRFAVLVEPRERIEVVVADPDDNKFLGCAIAGGADYIVSGDAHLVEMEEYRGIQILTSAEFLAVLGER